MRAFSLQAAITRQPGLFLPVTLAGHPAIERLTLTAGWPVVGPEPTPESLAGDAFEWRVVAAVGHIPTEFRATATDQYPLTVCQRVRRPALT